MNQQPLNLRTVSLPDEMRSAGAFLTNHELDKRHMQKVLLEWRLEEFRREWDEATKRAMVWS